MWKNKIFSAQFVREDVRKLGINIVTAGIAGWVISHITSVTLYVLFASIGMSLLGVLIWLFAVLGELDDT